jgi:SAM-dependent methyltransferase
MIKICHKIINKLHELQTEERTLAHFLAKVPRHAGMRILDVGCGYGRNIKFLSRLGYNIVGVEANREIVKANKENGLTCLSVEEFEKSAERYDGILMFHVIEHFHPDDLLPFLDHYLERLKPGGFLIIMTPLQSPYFYDDFDHIKPYSPVGIHMVFGGDNAQVQYYAKNKIELMDIWFRRSPLRIPYYKGRFLGGQYHIRLMNVIFMLLFRATFHLLGRCDGWMGLYRKKS